VTLEKYCQYFEEELQVNFLLTLEPCNLKTIACELRKHLTGIFTNDSESKRKANGQIKLFNNDEHFKNMILFYEYFYGDNGKRVGDSHQAGWTGVIT